MLINIFLTSLLLYFLKLITVCKIALSISVVQKRAERMNRGMTVYVDKSSFHNKFDPKPNYPHLSLDFILSF